MLDPEDSLARCLALDGEALPTGIVETRSRFTVEWEALYTLEGDFLTVAYDDGRVKTISGYPVAAIRDVIRRLRLG